MSTEHTGDQVAVAEDAAVEESSETEATPVETPVEDVSVEALRAEIASLRKESAAYRVKAKTARDELANAKTPEEMAEALHRAETAELGLHRERLGRKFGLPSVIAELITGDDEDAREAHAKAIATEIGKPRQARVGAISGGGLDPSDTPTRVDPAALAASVPRRRY